MEIKVNKYYDNNKIDIKKIFNYKKNYKCKFNDNIIYIYDSNNNLILKAKYCIIGIYLLQKSVWYWSYGLNLIDKKFAKNTINIKKNANNINDDFYRYISKNSSFFVDQENTEKIAKFAMYQLKGKWMVKINRKGLKYNNDNEKHRIEYILLTDILNF